MDVTQLNEQSVKGYNDVSNIDLEEFSSPPEWKSYGHINEPLGETLNGFLAPKCQNDDGICDLGDVRIIRRIGSESSRAMVFHTKICNGDRACKLLLATETNPENKNLDEIYITTKLGAKYPTYFTKVYTIGKCSNVNIPDSIKNNELIKDAEIWHIRSIMLPTLGLSKREIKMLEVEYRKTFNSDVYYNYLDQLFSKWSDQGIFSDENLFKLPALVMCSELGFGDLKQWSLAIRTIDNWKYIIRHILEALEILKRENITHSDLHHGNILLVLVKSNTLFSGQEETKTENTTVKIIDFGEFKNEYIPGIDFGKFLEGFDYIINLPTCIKQLVNHLKQNIYRPYEELDLSFC
jgi:hypothetical protein